MSNFNVGDFGEQPDVVKAPLADAANRQPDALIGAEDLLGES
jgi:hypothetical protein